MYRVLIFGDSVIAGRGVTKSQSWPVLLSDYLFNNKKFFVYELGINSENSTELLVRLRQEILSRVNKMSSDEKLIIILGIGLNDSKKALGALDTKKLVNDFSANLKKIFKICKHFSSKIILVGPNPVNDARMKELEIPLRNHFISEYSKTIEDVCLFEKASFINIFDFWSKKNYLKYLSDDGMHPSLRGHSIIYKIIAKNIIK